ncbi:MAG: aminoacyl-tRNA hydrolase [Bacillota bacterium]
MFVIVGLGNPGRKYESTRHNIGFNIINALAKELNIKLNKTKHKSILGQKFINGEKVMLVKPQTYMNKSGEAIRDIVSYYNVDLDKLLVIYDDVDTPLGSIRIKRKGSGGSHNGMKNIIYLLKTQEVHRLKFGIGRPNRMPMHKYVLGKFKKENYEIINKTIKRSIESIKCYVDNGIDKAMNNFNG